MTSKPVPIPGGTILGLSGPDFALIAANTTDVKVQSNKSQLLKLTPKAVMGTSGFDENMKEFSDLMFSTAVNYMAKQGKMITTESLKNVIFVKLYEMRETPYAINTMLAGLDSTGRGVVQSYDPIGACVQSGLFCTIGSGMQMLDDILDTHFECTKQEDKILTVQEACDVAYKCLSLMAAQQDKFVEKNIEVQIIKEEGIEIKKWNFEEKKTE